MHAGYGFAIGNVAAMDMANPESVISPGGVGFDINCGVRLIRTNLFEKDLTDVKVWVSIFLCHTGIPKLSEGVPWALKPHLR